MNPGAYRYNACVPFQSRRGETSLQRATGETEEGVLALMVRGPDEPGVLHELTRVISDHRANITYVDIAERHDGSSTVYFELEDVARPEVVIRDLQALPIV